MSNPFDDTERGHLALINHEGQYSLWPQDLAVPDGWRMAFEGSLQQCTDYIDNEWVDMRPASLIAEMQKKDRLT